MATLADAAMFVSSPATVDVTAFDAFWGADDQSDSMLFPDMAFKPLDLSVTTDSGVSLATGTTDEDAWLFGGDKLGFAVRDIRVSHPEDEQPVAEPTPLSIDVQQHDEDSTSVFLEPIMGSPVDELDAMTAFMVDDVDPFQEVVVTSDEEPMSPAASPINTARHAPYSYQAEEKKLEKLRSTVSRLEKMYYARCHGQTESDDSVDFARVKVIRTIERLQRVASSIARENYAFRQDKMAQRPREEMLLHELSHVLKSEFMNEQLRQSVADKLCSEAIVSTARISAQAAIGMTDGQDFMGWACTKNVEAVTGLLNFTAKKEFQNTNFEQVTRRSWELLVSSEQFAAFMKNDKTTRSHILKRLSEDAVLVVFDSVIPNTQEQSARVERDVCVAFRVRTTSGMMIGITSLDPTLFEHRVNAVDGVSFVQKGMRWMQFSQVPAGFSVVAGGRKQCMSRAAADSANLGSLALVLMWERKLVAPVFTLSL